MLAPSCEEDLVLRRNLSSFGYPCLQGVYRVECNGVGLEPLTRVGDSDL
jgi:hypothetical protein